MRSRVASSGGPLSVAPNPRVPATFRRPADNSNKDHQLEGEPARLGLEAMFVAAGVSAIFSGHVHA